MIKPILGHKVNFQHPLTKNCVGVWLMNEGAGSGLENLINQKTTINPLLRWSNNQQGSCLSISEGTTIDLDSLNNLLKSSSTKEFSFILGIQKTNSSLGNSTNLGNTQFSVQIPNASGSVVWKINNSTVEVATSLNREPSIWTFVNSARGMEIWQDSKLLAQNNLLNPLVNVSGNLYLGNKEGNYNFLYAFDKALSSEDIKSLSINPYQLVQKNNYLLFEDKVVKLGGEAEVNSTQSGIVDGGVRLGGIASTSYIPTPYLPTGGLNCNGIGLNLRLQIEIASGGGVIDGLSINDTSLSTFGGIRLSGISPITLYDIIEEVSDGEGGVLNGASDVTLNYFIDSSDGVLISGVSPISDFLNGRGGIIASGTTFVFPGSTSAFGTGGINCGGATTVGWYIQERIDSFGLKLDGRAINIRRGTIINVRSGISLSMKNNNFIKDQLIKKTERIIIPKESIISNSTIIDYRLEQTARWCYIEDCSDNVLPRIVEKRQGEYIPARIRSDEPRNRQIARATGI